MLEKIRSEEQKIAQERKNTKFNKGRIKFTIECHFFGNLAAVASFVQV